MTEDEPEEPEPVAALRKPLPTPRRLDLVRLFDSDATGVTKILGKPGRDEFDNERYDFEDRYVTVEYRDGKAARIHVASDVKSSDDLLAWMKPIDESHAYVESSDFERGAVSVASTRLPETRLNVWKILGKPRREAATYLGPANQDFWQRDGYMVYLGEDDQEGVLRSLTITFDSGIRPSEREREIRKWCNAPVEPERFLINGKRYTARLDTMSITFERRYLNY